MRIAHVCVERVIVVYKYSTRGGRGTREEA